MEIKCSQIKSRVRSDEGLMFETSALELYVTNSNY